MTSWPTLNCERLRKFFPPISLYSDPPCVQSLVFHRQKKKGRANLRTSKTWTPQLSTHASVPVFGHCAGPELEECESSLLRCFQIPDRPPPRGTGAPPYSEGEPSALQQLRYLDPSQAL
ncbi:hypothetical protein TNCT_441671 [Trichonephila clavata]|uniref:Uncharacterized protein n=1 Tax=Trichonephila clavata TaxID=2740835 RepID=A0A8X6JG76_TRICU|nr:hypothetical protein TNCT_441671 [Trichonephila clavata]